VSRQSWLTLDVIAAAVRTDDEIAVAIRHVVERHRRQRLEEGHAVLREEAVPDSAVDHDHVARLYVPGLALDCHRHLAVDDRHHLLGVLVAVVRYLLAGLVRGPT